MKVNKLNDKVNNVTLGVLSLRKWGAWFNDCFDKY